MSRYQWPTKAKGKDRLRQRMEYNAVTTGTWLPEELKLSVDDDALPPTGIRAAPSADANLWVPIGPSAVISGMAGSRPRISGRVRDIAVSDDGNRAYAATANGGIWYSSDAGLTWSPLGNWVPTPTTAPIDRPAQVLACGCLLVTFGVAADGSGDDVYVGTGELIPTLGGSPGSRLGGVGVLHLESPLSTALANPFGIHWKREAKNLTGAGIYRLARDPANANTLVAATSNGLFKRTGAFVEDADWNVVAGFDFTASASRTTDVAWVSTAPARLWVAATGGSDTGVFTSTAGLAGPFNKLSLPGIVAGGRLGFGVARSDKTIVYVLGAGPRLWRISGVTVAQVTHLPLTLFMSASDQSDYDLAIGVQADNPNIVAVGGATYKADGEYSASLFKFNIAAAGAGFTAGFDDANQGNPIADPTFIGNGVHADVHQILFVKVGGAMHVWVGCDGGVFRSDTGGNQHTFVARNTGLAVLEAGYVACHPDNSSFVIVGAQDNGTIMRVGNTVWMKFVPGSGDYGDGGCVVINPAKKRYFMAEYTNASWYSNGTLSRPIRRGIDPASENAENGKAFFYNTADARQVGATSQVRLALGTNRVWLADNWDPEAASTAWVTIPSNTDPRASAPPDETQDAFKDKSGRIVACRWVDDTRLLVLMRSSNKDGSDSVVRLHTRAADGKWPAVELSKKSNKCSDFSNGDIPSGAVSDFLPPLGAWSDIAVHVAGPGQAVSCYVACTGQAGADRMDTLWWYDGTGKWHSTGLAVSSHSALGSIVTKAPAYAVVVDPSDTTTVYVGTAIGVYKGTLTFDGVSNPPAPLWVFRPFVNGLPEAAVQDLAFFNAGGVRLLRAAIQARGVWEVDLTTSPLPTRRTFLRVHPTDSRRTATTSLENPMLAGLATWDWHATPDIRIRPAPLEAGDTAPPAPPAAWVGSSPNQFQLWIFQTALHKLDARCRANGQWTAQFSAVLIQRFGANAVTPGNWGAIVIAPNVFSPPWDGADPTEADLFELVLERNQDPNPAVGPPSISPVQPRKHKVDVMIHHRDIRPATNARATLLRRELPNDAAQWPGIAISADFKTKLALLMGGGAPAFPDGWTVADTITSVREPSASVEARLSRGVTFDVNFAGNAGKKFVLLGVVQSQPDQAAVASLVGDTLQDLILNSHQVAARVVDVSVP
jgi:hypothetical protein